MSGNILFLGNKIFEIPPFFETRPGDLGKKVHACSLRFSALKIAPALTSLLPKRGSPRFRPYFSYAGNERKNVASKQQNKQLCNDASAAYICLKSPSGIPFPFTNKFSFTRHIYLIKRQSPMEMSNQRKLSIIHFINETVFVDSHSD